MNQNQFAILLTGLVCLLSQSCGGGGSSKKLFDVSGSVTFAGKPVPYGSVLFVADADEGNSGPQGVATIENGKFNTAEAGRGVVGGAYTVIIKGRSQQSTDDEDEGHADPPLFMDYQTAVEFPLENTVQEFEVPEKREQVKVKRTQSYE